MALPLSGSPIPFVNFSNNAIHAGATADTLQLMVPPPPYYGYKYRRIAIKGKFVIWTDNANTDWNNPAIWSCISVPDEFSDAIIPPGRVRYPQVSASTSVRSISAYTGATVTTNNGVQLDIRRRLGNK